MDVTVDFRADIPSVRDQMHRQTCLAFALTAAHNFHQGCVDWFSVEYLFYHAVQQEPGKDPKLGISFDSAEIALRDEGQPDEQVWPYRKTFPGELPVPPNVDRLWYHGSSWELHNDVGKVLADVTQPIVVGLRLSQGFYEKPSSPFLVDDDVAGFGEHAVLGIGTGIDVRGMRWLLIRNSWGSTWGDSGDAWLSSRYLDRNLVGHMRLE